MTPYWRCDQGELYCGDAIEVLRGLPEASVQCVVTSPPYWGLRSYSGEQQRVWGGDEDCEHSWGGSQRVVSSGGPSEKQERNAGSWYKTSGGSSCLHCSAWRGSLGLEPTPELYVEHLVEVFREVRRVLRDNGTVWLNLGDSYASASACDRRSVVGQGSPDQTCARPNRLAGGLKEKDLCGIPWRVAFALQSGFAACDTCGLELRTDLWPTRTGHKFCVDCALQGRNSKVIQSEAGWWLRSDIIWSKPSPMPESVTDRPTRSHEYVFLLTKSARYIWDQEAVREGYADSTVRIDSSSNVSRRVGKWKMEANDDRHDGDSATLDHGPHRLKNTGRNIRTVWEIAEPRVRLRRDLTPEQRAYVLRRIADVDCGS